MLTNQPRLRPQVWWGAGKFNAYLGRLPSVMVTPRMGSIRQLARTGHSSPKDLVGGRQSLANHVGPLRQTTPATSSSIHQASRSCSPLGCNPPACIGTPSSALPGTTYHSLPRRPCTDWPQARPPPRRSTGHCSSMRHVRAVTGTAWVISGSKHSTGVWEQRHRQLDHPAGPGAQQLARSGAAIGA